MTTTVSDAAPPDPVLPRDDSGSESVPASFRSPPSEATAEERIAELERQVVELRGLLEAAAKPPDTTPGEAKPYDIGTDLTLKATWKHGLELESKNKDFRVHVGGRTQIDTVWLTASGDGLNLPGGGVNGSGTGDSVDFRRARLRVDGTLFDNAEWAAEYDFVGNVNANPGLQGNDPRLRNTIGVPAPTDVWWAFHEVPFVGNIRLGIQKEPLGLEHINSSRFLDFMERASIHDAYTVAFNNGFTPGVSVWDFYLDDERGMWHAGIYKLTNNVFAYDVSDGAYSVDGRLTWLPWYDDSSGGRYLCHTAVGTAYRSFEFDQFRIRTRGPLRNGPSGLAPLYTDTGTLDGDSQFICVPEFAVVHGPWHLQAEYAASWVSNVRRGATPLTGSYFSHGGYAELLYFLTGEHRVYEKKSGSFGRVVPFENANLVRGRSGPIFTRGAWQVGVRWSVIDLFDGPVAAGAVRDLTVGLNWFLNPNMKLQANYFFANRDIAAPLTEGHINGFGFRFAHDF